MKFSMDKIFKIMVQFSKYIGIREWNSVDINRIGLQTFNILT